MALMMALIKALMMQHFLKKTATCTVGLLLK